MVESLSTPKEWAKISKKFHGRTQHDLKNRFICVLSQELDNKRQKVGDLMKKNTIDWIIHQTSKNLSFEKREIMSLELKIKKHASEQIFEENEELIMEKIEGFKTIFYEEYQRQFEKNEEVFVKEDIFDIDGFINFEFEDKLYFL